MSTGSKKKVYAVAKGSRTGLFDSWDDAKVIVNGSSNCIYKSFFNRDAAIDYLQNHGVDLVREEISVTELSEESSEDLSEAEVDDEDQFQRVADIIHVINSDMKTVKSELSNMKNMLMKLNKKLEEKEHPATNDSYQELRSKIETLELANAGLRTENTDLRAGILAECNFPRNNDMQTQISCHLALIIALGQSN